MQPSGVPAASMPTADSDSEHENATAPAASLPTADSASSVCKPPAEPGASPSASKAGASKPSAKATPASPAHSQHTADALARLDEYDALAQRVLREPVLDPSTAVARLAQHIAAMAERIDELEGKAPAGKARARNSASILADADRELQLMEQLIKQQDEYIAKLETNTH